jgi:ParB family chromosome partitioning protein
MNTVTHQASDASEQAEAGPELQYLPLDKLRISPLNVRKSGGENIDELASLITSQGLLQNLIVVPGRSGKGKPNGYFEVVAGGRRLRALQKLAASKVLPAKEEILCKVVSHREALSVSIAENSGREPMSVADTVLAFTELVNAGATPEEVSVCFGVSRLTVERRLKLAHVSPKLFDLFREARISLEQLMALAICDDHAQQEAAWEGAKPWDRTPAALRRTLLGTARGIGDPLVSFVGLPAYEAAGGAVVRDLFAQDDGEHAHLADTALVESLANGKLAQLAVAVRAEGWAWVDIAHSFGYSERRAFLEARPSRREPTEVEARHLQALRSTQEAAQAALDAFYDEDDDGNTDPASEGTGSDARVTDPAGDRDRLQTLQAAVERADEELDQAQDALRYWTPELMAHAGAVVHVRHDGQAEIVRGLVRTEDRARAAAAQASSAGAGGPGSGEQRAGGDGGSLHDDSTLGRSLDASAKSKGEYSEPLMRRLTAHRTKALQALVADNPKVALAVLAHTLVQQLLEARSAYRVGTRSSADLTARTCDFRLVSDADDLTASPAWTKLQKQLETWTERLPADSDEVLPWLLQQPQEIVADLLALCIALTLDTGVVRGAGNSRVIAEAVSLNMADWWSPTAGSFLSHVPKSRMSEVIKEAVSEADAVELGKLKKAEAVAKAEALLSGMRWLPLPLRFHGQA